MEMVVLRLAQVTCRQSAADWYSSFSDNHHHHYHHQYF